MCKLCIDNYIERDDLVFRICRGYERASRGELTKLNFTRSKEIERLGCMKVISVYPTEKELEMNVFATGHYQQCCSPAIRVS